MFTPSLTPRGAQSRYYLEKRRCTQSVLTPPQGLTSPLRDKVHPWEQPSPLGVTFRPRGGEKTESVWFAPSPSFANGLAKEKKYIFLFFRKTGNIFSNPVSLNSVEWLHIFCLWETEKISIKNGKKLKSVEKLSQSQITLFENWHDKENRKNFVFSTLW
jgi:hypothetical protein